MIKQLNKYIVRQFNEDKYVSYRRLYLDNYLKSHEYQYSGIVLDVGGKKSNKRGSFRPNITSVANWIYLNINAKDNPDIVADAANLPFQSKMIDTVIMTELLEHIENPGAVSNEALRVLKDGGLLVGSIPFLHPYHSDPNDFGRFTFQGLEKMFSCFSKITILPMGGVFCTVATLLEEYGKKLEIYKSVKIKVLKRLIYVVSKLTFILDIKLPRDRNVDQIFSNGFFFICKK